MTNSTNSSFTNFFNNSQTFGMNIKIPERTLKEVGKTASNVAGGVLEPLFTYLEENENIFSGDISKEVNKINVINFNISMSMAEADKQTNGVKSSFDTKF